MNVPQLTEEQEEWLSSKLEGFDLVVVTYHGSHLYGLDREGSDIDVKAIYLPSKQDLLYGKALKTHNFKNDELDIEIEIKSISSFLNSAASCDTNCLDMLHTPWKMVLHEKPLWVKMKSLRSKLYAKNMRGIVGYIKTHAKKYTNKIDRLNEMKSLLQYVALDTHENVKVVRDIAVGLKSHGYKYVQVVKPKNVQNEHPYLEVCGKKYIFTLKIEDFKSALEVSINSYGKRSNKGAEKGIDSKSLSHALRVLLQLKEIVSTGGLEFPLKDVEYVKKVKLGEVVDLDEVLGKVDSLYEECMQLLKDSDLPEEVDISEMCKLVEDYYFL